jgi:hypothetical protein
VPLEAENRPVRVQLELGAEQGIRIANEGSA